MSSLLVIGGFVLAIIGGIWFLTEAFKENFLWGLGVLFVPFASLIFLILHLDKTWKPALVQLVGLALMVTGAMLKPQAPPGYMSLEGPKVAAAVVRPAA